MTLSADKRAWMGLAALVLFLLPAAKAQESGASPKAAPPTQEAAPVEPAGNEPAAATRPIDSVTIEKIMDQAVRNIARRYNLNEAQTEKTAEIMKQGVHRFLKEHENEVWPLVRDMLGSGFQPPEKVEDVKRIGKAARPIVEKAKEAILRGNEEWRMYLTPEQKRMHDYDLAEMAKTFDQIDQNLQRWAQGAPPDGSLFPAPPPPEESPPTPGRPERGLPDPVVEVFDPRTIFDTFVEEFIKDYELDEGQVDSARSILVEFKAKAKDFRSAHKQELAKITEDMRTALEDRDRKRLAEIDEARKELLAPVYELFDKMEDRLRALLTTAQIEKHASGRKTRQAGQKVNTVRRRTAEAQKRKVAPPAQKAEESSNDDGTSDSG